VDTIAILQDCLEYVDSHLQDALTVEFLAARAGFSKWHFCRVFRWGTGLSVMGYVRWRRLAFAAYALNTGQKILDISLAYGFGTHSGFSKAFRRHYGCSPEIYRFHARAERPSLPDLSRMKKYQIGGILMEPKFNPLPALKLAGFVLRTNSNEGQNLADIPAFWSAYLADGRMERLHQEAFLKGHAEYGVCFMDASEAGALDYVIGVEIKPGTTVPDDYHVCEVPAADYAVFSTPPSDAADFSKAIQGTWQYIFNEWFPASGYEYAPGCADFELYDERCMGETGKVCDIYIPIVEKRN